MFSPEVCQIAGAQTRARGAVYKVRKILLLGQELEAVDSKKVGED
jgi:hypothetical protein